MLNNFDETKIINTLKDVILNIKSHITSESFYDKYIYTITLNSFNNSIIFINLADSFGKKIFDSTYSAIFLDLFKKYFNENIAIQTCLPNEKPILPRTIDLQDYKETNLMNDVTFGSLQIGEFNKNAFKAGEMIAKNKK
jgi:chromosomal replication initiation ATPase DnaA